MTLELLLAFVAYAFVTSITPGPNNTMLLASGVNHGLVATIPHMLGINLGFSALVFACGLGIAGAFQAFPVLQSVLRYGGAAYLLYLAWKIAASGAPGAGGAKPRPMGFLEAAAFQWVNPKAWIMAVGAIATYTPPGSFLGSVALVTLVFAVVNAPCILAWVTLGSALRGLLSRPATLRAFNISMALLLVASLWPILTAAIG